MGWRFGTTSHEALWSWFASRSRVCEYGGVSVCSNIAEAWRKRRYPAYFVSKLSDSDSEAAETQVWLDFAPDCGYISQEEHDSLYATYENIAGGLAKMMANPDAWCGPSQLRESTAPYYTHTLTP